MSCCPICLERISGEAYLDHCFHKFCYHCILQWSEVRVSRNALIECPLCKTHYSSIVHDFNGANFQRHYVLNSSSSESRVYSSAAHARRLAVYQQGSEAHPKSRPSGNGDNSKWHFCWLQRELQGLMQDDDVDIVAHHILGTVETLRKRICEFRLTRRLPSVSELARADKLDREAIAAAAQPFVFTHASRFAEELLAFFASGLNISSYDELCARPAEASELAPTDLPEDTTRELVAEFDKTTSDKKTEEMNQRNESESKESTRKRSRERESGSSSPKSTREHEDIGKLRVREYTEASSTAVQATTWIGILSNSPADNTEEKSTERDDGEETVSAKPSTPTQGKTEDVKTPRTPSQHLEAQLREKALANLRRHLSCQLPKPAEPALEPKNSSATPPVFVNGDKRKELPNLHTSRQGAEQRRTTPQPQSDEPSLLDKTMSVTRGSEQVQVSYKVYIPQRSTSTKRRLQR